jgi:hypothetical protein
MINPRTNCNGKKKERNVYIHSGQIAMAEKKRMFILI